MKNRLTQVLMVAFVALMIVGCGGSDSSSEAIEGNDFLVTIKTDFGDMKVILYDETPEHKANFLKLTNEGYFDNLLFHRVIKNFMIQGGDPDSRGAALEQRLGSGGPDYTIPAEINPDLFHRKGALSAARQPDQVNPQKASSGSQFYIVHGNVTPRAQLEGINQNLIYQAFGQLMQNMPNDPLAIEYNEVMAKYPGNNDSIQAKVDATMDQLSEKTGIRFEMPEDQIEVYSTVGGYPPLDGGYTVFGQVISGLEVIDAIAEVETRNKQVEDRPLEDVKMRITVEEMSRADIQEKFDYKYPVTAINE
ncbi:peptidylprolyl isomerase [Roseivirga sp.]|uniref:peptidylprolyl isomerase n=1 Tax=Roseivirga sp. TaxID=1964215 RepID=UPI003B8DF746